jgi:hypothetical protein
VESTTTSITNYCEDGQDPALVEKMLGRVTFYDCLWKDSKNVHMKENILGAEISFESKSGRKETIDYLPKSQASSLCSNPSRPEPTRALSM